MNEKKWSTTEEAIKLLRIGRSRLMDLKASGELIAGLHWVYLTGRKSGPIGWSIDAIHEWQIEQSRLITQAPLKAAESIESYEAIGLES